MSKKTESPKPELVAYTPEQAAQAMSMSRSLLYKLWKEGDGPAYFKKGTRRFVARSAVERYVDQQS